MKLCCRMCHWVPGSRPMLETSKALQVQSANRPAGPLFALGPDPYRWYAHRWQPRRSEACDVRLAAQVLESVLLQQASTTGVQHW